MSSKSGTTLIEIVIAFGLAAILLPALFTGIYVTQSGKAQQIQRLGALNLLKEEEEAVRSVREKNWENFAALDNGSSYHVQPASPTWSLVVGTDNSSAGYHRWITINKYSRSGNDDPSTKKVDLFVSWDSPIPTQVNSTMYLTRYVSNNFFTDTTTADFQKTENVFSGTTVVDPGQITLVNQPGGADWCDPGSHLVANTNLGGNGLAGNVVAGTNRAFVGTGKNASSHPFYNVLIDNGVYPPVPSNPAGANYDAAGLKANDVFGESHYAYLAPDNNSNEEAIILDVTNSTPSFVKSIDISGNKGSRSIFVSDNILYLIATNNKLYTYNITDRANSVALGQIAVGAASNKMYVVNGYVFVATNSSFDQLIVFNATDPVNISKIASLTVNDQPAVGIFVLPDGSRTYLATNQSASRNDFFIINTSNPNTPSVIGAGYNTTTMDPRGLTVIDNRAIIVGFTSPQYQVVKVDNDGYVQCAAFPLGDNIYNVSSIRINNHAYSYIVTDNTNKAFQIIEGGLGGAGGYVSSGTYESGSSWPALPMPTAANTAFNHFDVTYVKPNQTDIKFQVSVVDAPGGNCANASYVGPGQPPTTGTFSTGAGNGGNPVVQSFPIPFGTNASGYQNAGKCFRYKVTMTTNSNLVTPILNDITVNYSP